MTKEDLKKKVEEILIKMGYTNIAFSNGEEDFLVASFDSKELTSFKADLPDWTYSGITLFSGDQTHGQYKIEFRKIL